MKKFSFLSFVCLLVMSGMFSFSLAGPMDGEEYFSLDADTNGGGVVGDVYYSDEDGTFEKDIVTINTSQDLDALSTAQHPPVTPRDIYWGTFKMTFSIDGDSDIYEWTVGGTPIDIQNNYLGPRDVCMDGHFANQAPHQVYSLVHDDENDLGLADYDLDALEHGIHYPPYPEPFPTHAYGGAYFSVEGTGNFDEGDVYFDDFVNPVWHYFDDTLLSLYLDSQFDPDENQIDALVVFDIVHADRYFEVGDPNNPYDADLILFSLAPGSYDPVGDNIYWVNANGYGGLLFDPELDYNVDAIDVHNVPEPTTGILLLAGLAIGFWFKRKTSKKALSD
ncbi:PEP-CTERM sorting domain-containing protein [Thermodesulfatator atlanticus]|uniref:PEP-CTERM sorting domain-containing protein n=1 Tax=Thermodesulfatator atlanticus TaxID=501497 RepID=UPI00146E8D2D|nr:PEP-CTERM sorting domain-containing protein [Thermodesulfatator atlanticus]